MLAPGWLPGMPTTNADELLLALGVKLKLNMAHSDELTESVLLARIEAAAQPAAPSARSARLTSTATAAAPLLALRRKM